MSSISGISGLSTGLSTSQVGIQFQIAALKQQQNVMKEMGQMTVQLIQSASIADPAVGRNLNVTA